MTKHKVVFSDACSDVLAWLAAQQPDTWWTWHGIRDAVAPDDAVDAGQTVASALRTLRECALVQAAIMDGFPGWRITDAGREAVAAAVARAGSQPISDPSGADHE